MTMRKLATVVFLACMALQLHSICQAVETAYLKSGAWEISVNRGAAVGKFLGCSMRDGDVDGYRLSFLTLDGTRLFLFARTDEWTIKPNESYDVSISVDRHHLFSTSAYSSTTGQGVHINLGASPELWSRLRRGSELSMTLKAETLRYSLTGTFAALDQLQKCVVTGLAAAAD